jgi:hypothetical protein
VGEPEGHRLLDFDLEDGLPFAKKRGAMVIPKIQFVESVTGIAVDR